MNTAKLKTLIMLAKNEPVRQLTPAELQHRCNGLAAAVVELGHTRPRIAEHLKRLQYDQDVVIDAEENTIRELWAELKRQDEYIEIEVLPAGACRVFCLRDTSGEVGFKALGVAAIVLGLAAYFG